MTTNKLNDDEREHIKIMAEIETLSKIYDIVDRELEDKRKLYNKLYV